MTIDPQHLAIIMDGNRRWAVSHGLPEATDGHRQGIETLRELLPEVIGSGVQVLTLFVLSSENMSRSKREVDRLMALVSEALDSEMKLLHEREICLRVIGDLSSLKHSTLKRIRRCEAQTRDYSQLQLLLAFCYGGRWDTVQAARCLAEQVLAGQLQPQQIDEKCFEACTAFAGEPPPDLCIRTGGECRLSNFMLWHLAYTELFFTDTLWPDFSAAELQQIISTYRSRQRRFGSGKC